MVDEKANLARVPRGIQEAKEETKRKRRLRICQLGEGKREWKI